MEGYAFQTPREDQAKRLQLPALSINLFVPDANPLDRRLSPVDEAKRQDLALSQLGEQSQA